MKESTAYRHNTCVTLFQDDSSVSFLLSLISSPFQAQPILLLPFPISNGILSSYLLSQASAHHPSLLLCLSKLPLKKPSSLSLNPLTWFHSSHMATQNCDTWQKIELHKSEKNEPQKWGSTPSLFVLFIFFILISFFLFSFLSHSPHHLHRRRSPSPLLATWLQHHFRCPLHLSLILLFLFIFVLFYFICFDFNSKGLGGELMWNFGLFTFGELIWNLNYFFVDKI